MTTDSLASRLVRRAKLAHEVDETGEVVVFDEAGHRLLMLERLLAWLAENGAAFQTMEQAAAEFATRA